MVLKLSETEAFQESTHQKLTEMEAVLEETSPELTETKALQEETQEKLVETEGVLEEMKVTLQKSEEAKKDQEGKLTNTEVVEEQLRENLVEREQELLARSTFLDETQERYRAFFADMLEGFDEKHYTGVDTMYGKMAELLKICNTYLLLLRSISKEAKVVEKIRENPVGLRNSTVNGSKERTY